MKSNLVASRITNRPFIILLSVFILLSCESIDYRRVVKVQTGEIVTLTSTSVSIKGIIIDSGEQGISRLGHCWARHASPTVQDEIFNLGENVDTGEYVSDITGLLPGTIYFIRAFAAGDGEIAYGEILELTTKTGLVQIETTEPANITLSSVTIGGNITDDGGIVITERGVCWNTAQLPVPADNKKTDTNTGMGEYLLQIGDLWENVPFYFRAYAMTSADTFYGPQKTVTLWLNYPGPDVEDIDGNIYSTVKIGTQVWMTSNLKTTRLNDGSSLDEITDNLYWQNSIYPAYCWYDNNIASAALYGALYNWYAVNTGKLCPSGWHVPDFDTDWYTLISYLGGSEIAGQKLKEEGLSHWSNPNCADNQSGFAALPAGLRYTTEGAFAGLSTSAYWWSSSGNAGNLTYSYSFKTDHNSCSLDLETHTKGRGFSVRCIKN